MKKPSYKLRKLHCKVLNKTNAGLCVAGNGYLNLRIDINKSIMANFPH